MCTDKRGGVGYTCSALLGVILGDSLIAIATGLSSWDGGPAVAKASVPVFTVTPATASVISAARGFLHLYSRTQACSAADY